MKNSKFFWAYGSADLGRDYVMTRPRAARILSAWRAAGYKVTRNHTAGRQLWRVQTGGLVALMALEIAGGGV